jgi:hypothetical protein
MSLGPPNGESGAREVEPGGESPRVPPRSEIGARTEIRPPPRPPGATLRVGLRAGGLVALALAFEIAYGQAPLYSGDQNAHVLDGLAQAGVGLLPLDWLAGTVDPTPVFSLLVALAAALDAQWLLLVLHAALIGVYGLALLSLGVVLLRLEGALARLLLVALLLAVHCWVATRLTIGLPVDVRSLLTDGLAGQHAPGETFEPSLFGVLIVASLLVYARGRLLGAVALACVAAVVHPAYLISAFVVCTAYFADAYARSRDFGAVARAVALATVLLVPITVYVLLALAPAPGDLHAQAQSVLVDLRLVEHAKPSRWMGRDDGLRLLIVAGGLLVAWRTVLFPVLALSVAAGSALTALQVATGSDTLALLFAWRLSVWLVPVSTALLLAAATKGAFAVGRWLAGLAARRGGGRAARVVQAGRVATGVLAGLLIAVALVAGLPAIERLSPEPRREPYASLLAGRARPGMLLLVPRRMSDVRVAAGVPVYVDDRSHPYADLDVLEWQRRLAAADRAYGRGRLDCRRVAALTAREGVTDVLTAGPMGGERCPRLALARRSGTLALFRAERGR